MRSQIPVRKITEIDLWVQIKKYTVKTINKFRLEQNIYS